LLARYPLLLYAESLTAGSGSDTVDQTPRKALDDNALDDNLGKKTQLWHS